MRAAPVRFAGIAKLIVLDDLWGGGRAAAAD